MVKFKKYKILIFNKLNKNDSIIEIFQKHPLNGCKKIKYKYLIVSIFFQNFQKK